MLQYSKSFIAPSRKSLKVKRKLHSYRAKKDDDPRRSLGPFFPWTHVLCIYLPLRGGPFLFFFFSLLLFRRTKFPTWPRTTYATSANGNSSCRVVYAFGGTTSLPGLRRCSEGYRRGTRNLIESILIGKMGLSCQKRVHIADFFGHCRRYDPPIPHRTAKRSRDLTVQLGQRRPFSFSRRLLNQSRDPLNRRIVRCQMSAVSRQLRKAISQHK